MADDKPARWVHADRDARILIGTMLAFEVLLLVGVMIWLR